MTRYQPLWQQSGSYAATVDRRLISALWPAAAASGCAVSVAGSMTLNVAPGQVSVPSANNTGAVLCSSDAVEQVVIPAAPAGGTNRIDLVTCQARGYDLDGGANNDFIFTSVQGVPAASPVVPATPANAVTLAQVYVGGGVASIVAGNITDVRPSGLSIPAPAPPTMQEGSMTMFSGSKAAGNYTSPTFNLPAPTVPSRMVGWVGGQQGFGAAATSVQYSIIRNDNSGHLLDSGALQAPAASTVALPANSGRINPINPGQVIGIYATVSITGSNNYFGLAWNWMLFPL